MTELFEQEVSTETTQPYSVFYTDGSYVVYDLTKEDYAKIKQAMMTPLITVQNWTERTLTYVPVVELSIGLMKLTDVRSVIVQREVPENKATNPMLTEDEILWLDKWKRAATLGEEVGVVNEY